MHTVAHHIASLVQAIENCRQSKNIDWESRHAVRLSALIKEYMPSGSGWDCGTKLDIDVSSDTKLVFYGEFHHMDESGVYAGWTTHKVIARPGFDDVRLSIGGSDRNSIKDYLHDTFHVALIRQVAREDIDALYIQADKK